MTEAEIRTLLELRLQPFVAEPLISAADWEKVVAYGVANGLRAACWLACDLRVTLAAALYDAKSGTVDAKRSQVWEHWAAERDKYAAGATKKRTGSGIASVKTVRVY